MYPMVPDDSFMDDPMHGMFFRAPRFLFNISTWNTKLYLSFFKLNH